MMEIGNYLCDEEIFNLLKKYDSVKRMYHLQKVAYYSNMLANILSEKSNAGSFDVNMLKYASLLHDIGYFINKERHHKHSKYIVLCEELFEKLPANERNILALLVSSHRKKLDKEINYYPRIEQRKIIELVSILRLADALDYGKDYVVGDSHIDNNVLYLKLVENPSEKTKLKLMEKSQLFKDTFNMEVSLLLK